MGSKLRKSVVLVIGTRPEAIKMAPLALALRAAPWAHCRILLTGQHRELVDGVLEFFGLAADTDLDVMRLRLPAVALADHLVGALSSTLAREKPDIVLAQGDTSSVVAAALASFHLGFPFGHVEAGLRSRCLYCPYPEEANRVIASHCSAIHFAPTDSARRNLEREGISGATIHVTGNTVIDALLATARRNVPLGFELDSRKRLVLVTAHRRDSFGAPLVQICRAVQELHEQFPDIQFVWPVHPNPAVKPVVESLMTPFSRVRLCAPLPYGAFVSAMKRAALVLTDSGGVQEEAPALGKPVLVMRNESERPEVVELGLAKLVGQEPSSIVGAASRLLRDADAYQAMTTGSSPYGDGRAAPRIVTILGEFLRAPFLHAAPRLQPEDDSAQPASARELDQPVSRTSDSGLLRSDLS